MHYHEQENIEVNFNDGAKYSARIALDEMEIELGDGFIRVSRSCLVAAMVIHDVASKIEIVNGKLLKYPPQSKWRIVEQFSQKCKTMIDGLSYR